MTTYGRTYQSNKDVEIAARSEGLPLPPDAPYRAALS